MNPLSILLLVLAAQFFSPSASAQATCAGNGAGEPGCAGAGNPINVITGNKFQREVDLAPLPGVMGLEIVRYYNSSLSGLNSRTGILGRGWRLSYETTIAAIGDTVQVLQADGTRLIFARDLLRPSLCSSSDPANGEIDVRRTANGDEYVWRKRDGQRLSFNHQGRLVQILAPTGEFVSMQHDARGWLVKVTDPQGRSLRLDYLDKKQAASGTRFAGVQGIDSPLGRFTYAYGSAMPEGARVEDRRQLLANLVDVGMPDGIWRRYHYEDARFPTLLTGISAGKTEHNSRPSFELYATFGYDANGEAELSTHANNVGRVTLDRSIGGKTTLTNSLGQKTVYRYGFIAGERRIQEVRGPGCTWCGLTNVRYRYDQSGRLIEQLQLSPDGTPRSATSIELDGLGRTIRVYWTEYRHGRALRPVLVERNAYTAEGMQPTMVVRPSVLPGRELVERRTYNSHGQLLKVTQDGWAPMWGVSLSNVPISRTTVYTYQSINNRSVLVQVDGPEHNGQTQSPIDSDITRLQYDQTGGRLVRIVKPGNIISEFSLEDAALRSKRIRTTDGARLTQIDLTLALDGTVLAREETAWQLMNGQPVASTRKTRTESNLYDARGRLIAHRSGTDLLTRYLYAGGENPSHVIAVDNSQKVTSRDTEGNIVEEAAYGPGGYFKNLHLYRRHIQDQQATDVNSFATPLSVRDASRKSVGWDFQSSSTASERDASFGETELNFSLAQDWINDAEGQAAKNFSGQVGSVAGQLIERVVRADGSEVRRWFDDFSRLVAVRSPDRGLRVATYTDAGNLRTINDAINVETRVENDVAGRVRNVRYFDKNSGNSVDIDYIYNGMALAEARRSENGILKNTIFWTSDVWGTVIGKSLHIASTDAGISESVFTIRNAINQDGGLLHKTLPSGIRLLYQYDEAGRLASLIIDKKKIVNITRNWHDLHGGHKPSDLVFGNGLAASTVHDASGRLLMHDSGVEKAIFKYDGFEGHGATMARGFDIDFSRGQKKDSSKKLNITHQEIYRSGDGNFSPGASSTIQYRYDQAGRLTYEERDGARELDIEYNSLGDRRGSMKNNIDGIGNSVSHKNQRLRYGPAGELVGVYENDEKVAEYGYDAEGVRIFKKGRANTEFYLYEEKKLVAVTDAHGNIESEYIYLGNRPVVRVRHVRQRAETDTAVSRKGDQWKIEYLHTDQRDAVTAITDEEKKVIWKSRLDAFGALRSNVGAENNMPLRLSGQYFDSETGLHYNVHRYYDPENGRYLQPDPLGIAAGLNTYAYTGNRPLDNSDPLGLHNEFKPWEFGTAVHIVFSARVTMLGPGWGGNNQRVDTWPGIRPDAYYVDPLNLKNEKGGKPFVGMLWELKPISWSSGVSPYSYNKGLQEVAEYKKRALKGCWAGGSGGLLAEMLDSNPIYYGGKLYEVTYVGDTSGPMSGLIFYKSEEKKGKPVPVLAPAPSISKEQKKKLEEQMQQIKVAVREQEGWSDLAIKGLQAVLLAAIAVAIAVFSAVVLAAIISTIAAYLATMSVGIVAALLSIMGISSVATAQEFESKGKEADSGIFDNVVNWFKDLIK